MDEEVNFGNLDGVSAVISDGRDGKVVSFEACVLGVSRACDATQLKLLPCFHPVCQPCIELKQDQELVCPCGMKGGARVQDLVTDYVRINEANKHTKKTCTYEEHEMEEDAVAYCRDCDDFLCRGCQERHSRRGKFRRHHVDDNGEDMQQSQKMLYCEEHVDEKAYTYDPTCKKAICSLCEQDKHRHNENIALTVAFEQKKESLLKSTDRVRSKLVTVQKLEEALMEHESNLNGVKENMQREVQSVCRRMEDKLRSRQNQLMADVENSLRVPVSMVHEKKKSVEATKKSATSIFDYMNRVINSATKTQLIELTDVVEEKSKDFLNIELPENDVRSSRMKFSPQGQKALEETIDEFGCFVTTLHGDVVNCSGESYGDLRRKVLSLTRRAQQEAMVLTDILAERDNERNDLKRIADVRQKEMRALTQELTKAKLERKKLTEVLKEAEREKNYLVKILKESGLMHLLSMQRRGDPCFVVCPPMHFDRTRVHGLLNLADQQKLVNKNKSGQHDPNQLQNLIGTCCDPFPVFHLSSTLASTSYWETNISFLVKRSRGVVEIGICEEEFLDRKSWISDLSRGWCLRVGRCHLHNSHKPSEIWEEGALGRDGMFLYIRYPTHDDGDKYKLHDDGIDCIQVWKEGRQLGTCFLNTSDLKVGIKLAILLDTGRGRLAFIDIDREKVLQKLDVHFQQAVFPVFCIRPEPDECETNIQLISGNQVAITDCKKALILEALSD